MKIRSSRLRAAGLSALIVGCGGLAHGQDARAPAVETRSLDACALGGGCAHFEGYVYVRRTGPAQPSAFGAPTVNPAGESGRLYVHVDGGPTR